MTVPEPPGEPVELTPMPLDVLFVCTANISRSPSLELLATRAHADPGLTFASAGTHGSDGHAMDVAMRGAIGDGPDAAAFRSRRLTPALLAGADLVLTAEVAHRTFILDGAPALSRKVFTLSQCAEAVRRAPGGLSRGDLLSRLADQHGTADPALDVRDPYRQGPEAARECADRMHELLDVVLPALTHQEARP